MTTTDPDQIWDQSRKRLSPGTVIGSVIEWYDIAVYGHTHVAEYTPGTPITVLNPGSAARPRDAARGSFMTVDLAPGKAPEVRLHRLGQK